MSKFSKKDYVEYLQGLTAGPELDRLMAAFLLDSRVEECDLTEDGCHLKGSTHFFSFVSGDMVCPGKVPRFSRDYELLASLIEYIVGNFKSWKSSWDCDHWSCEVNDTDSLGVWFRIAHVARCDSYQEAVCKVLLLAKLAPNPQPIQAFPPPEAKPKKRAKKKVKKVKPKKGKKKDD